jgi:hypothetical protein
MVQGWLGLVYQSVVSFMGNDVLVISGRKSRRITSDNFTKTGVKKASLFLVVASTGCKQNEV